MLDIIQAHALNNLCYITAQKMTPKGIVVHSTGANNPNLKRYVDAPEEVGKNAYGNHWNVAKPGGNKVCVHAFIGYDNKRQVRVAEILPLNICCWGVGKGNKGSYNYDPAYIQFEICEDGLADKEYYKKAFAVAAEYCAMLCRKYAISIDNIVGHCEAHKLGYGSNHSDPEHWMKRFGESMNTFRKQVCTLLSDTESEKTAFVKTTTTTSDSSMIYDGDLVSITNDATYYNGKTIPNWVKAQRWYVRGNAIGDRVVIDRNEKRTNSICSPIHKKYLTVVKSSAKSQPVVLKVSEPTTQCPYFVKVTTYPTNIHAEAKENSPIVGTISSQGVYTIVEEKKDHAARKWGKLKSGIGWIPLE